MWLAFGWGLDSPDLRPVLLTGGTQHIRTPSVKSYKSELLRSRTKPPFQAHSYWKPASSSSSYMKKNYNMYLHYHRHLSSKDMTISSPAPYRKMPSHTVVLVTLQPLVCLLLNYVFRFPQWVMVFFSSLSTVFFVCVWQLLMTRGVDLNVFTLRWA